MAGPWEAYRKACLEVGKADPGPWVARGPIFLWVTTDDKDAMWERLAPTSATRSTRTDNGHEPGSGKRRGPYIPTGDLDSLKQDGTYQVLTPDEGVELAGQLGTHGELHLNPLLAGINPEEAWKMLRTFEAEVLPHIGVPGERTPLPSAARRPCTALSANPSCRCSEFMV